MTDHDLAIRSPGFGDAPVGSVLAFAGHLGPAIGGTPTKVDSSASDDDHTTNSLEAWGWMLCDGRSLETGIYSELFTVLGYRYGGSGQAFNIPDYRGTFLRGTDLGANIDPDTGMRTDASGAKSDEVGSRQTCALQDHEHDVPTQATAAQGVPIAGLLAASPNVQQTGKIYDDPTAQPSVKISSNETRPINIAVNYIIKFTYRNKKFKF